MTDQTPETPAPNRRAVGCLLEIVETVVLTLILFWVIQSFVAQPFQVKQVSMRDTIQDGQFVLVDRLTPHFDSYHRGDIVVFHPPENNETGTDDPFIKRVIGVAGDTIAIHDGKVFVNGTELNEPYVFSVGGVAQLTTADPDPDSCHGDARLGHCWTIAPGELFVMGDHRAASSDSRVFGKIKIDTVIGRAWLRYWPLEDLGILPTQQHPELVGSSPGASHPPSASPSTRPSAKPTKRPTATPKH